MSVTRRSKNRLLALALAGASALLSGTTLAQSGAVSQWSLPDTPVKLVSTDRRQSIQMIVNSSREVTAEKPFKRVRIQNPNMVSAIPLEGGNRLQISAIATGVTQVDLVEADDSVHTVEVMVLGDVRELEAILRTQFPSAHLQVMPVQQGCIISGVVTRDADVEQVITIAELFFPTVVNKVQVAGVHTVQLETQIMEVSRTKLRELGIDWALSNGNDFVSQTVSGLIANTTTASGLTTAGNETFKIGVVQGSTQFFKVLRALNQNNLIKVLANPTLTAVDGRPASFNSGGEFPVIVPSGLGQVAVQFREFGTRVDFVAKVRGEGKIWLEVRPYVSEIDPTRSVTISGISVPGLRSRFLETGVEMQAGQTLVLGGLLQSRTEVVSTGLPWFKDQPYIGALFRRNSEVQNEVELLITVTPNFAGPLDPHELPGGGPGLNTQSPTDREFYWRGYMESPRVDNNCQTCGPGFAQGATDGRVMMTQSDIPMPAGNFGSSSMSPAPVTTSVGPNAPRFAEQYNYPNGTGPVGGTAQLPGGSAAIR